MKKCFKTEAPRIQTYMNENAEWQKILASQSNDIPKLEKLLNDVLNPATLAEDKNIVAAPHLKEQLLNQKMQMEDLNFELDVQQWRLGKNTYTNPLYYITVLCTQDKLRKRIKEVAKRYVDLKCDFMKYLPSAS